MKKVTAKEEEIMNFFWDKGALFVKEVLEFYPDPKPHYNTVSTMIRALADKEYLGYEAFGNTYRYYPVISRQEFNQKNLRNMVRNYFGDSYKRVISNLIEEEELSIEELRELIREIETNRKTPK